METLAEIGKRTGGTNKIKSIHNYIYMYEWLFKDYREPAEKVVEIGICRGASLRLWDAYFIKAHIYGLDVRLHEKTLVKGPKTTTHRVDQSNRKELEAFAEEHGPFDIIIDDGSHMWDHQILSFESLWPYMVESGLYVIEDINTSYEVEFKGGDITAMEYFKRIADEINHYGDKRWYERGGKAIDINLLTLNQRTIEWLMFKSTMVVLKKRPIAAVPNWGV